MYPYPIIMSIQYLCQFHMLFQTIIYVCIIIIVTCIHAHNYVLIPYILMKFLIPYVMAITQNPYVLHALVTDYCNIFVSIDNYVSCFILRMPISMYYIHVQIIYVNLYVLM